jgi:L-threonylcarbamoyladenylate synthase
MKTIVTKSPSKAASFVKRSEVVAFPTETVYGLGANVFDEAAAQRIFKLKNRPADNPLIVHISDKKQVELLAATVPEIARKIIKKFFPGPITIIVKKNEIVPDVVTANLNTVAIRMPLPALTRKFIEKCGVPIAAPSANLSGSPSPTSYRHVLEDFDGKIPCILKGSDAKFGVESTVVDCMTKIPAILRPGVVTLEQLRRIDKRIKVRTSGKIKSPGQAYRHYAPKAKVIVVSRPPARRKVAKPEFIPVLPFSFADSMTSIPPVPLTQVMPQESGKSGYIGITEPRNKNLFSLTLICKDANDYAKNLFSFFRKCDRKRIDVVFAQRVSGKGIGLAIMNRLKKAGM